MLTGRNALMQTPEYESGSERTRLTLVTERLALNEEHNRESTAYLNASLQTNCHRR